ncbi:MAG: hypothetical protein CVU06_06025 [Bacteroidetes bacterium HGW-Bacteroidetes-22]|nr:MAG: hypothetical protein CVU06_06025 [Bacteroidetes bacterium HGW-Bacteroidetes-22]
MVEPNPSFFIFGQVLSLTIYNMRKLSLLISTFLLFGWAIAQQVPRQMVILEIGTGTWCQYCPGAAMGADDLIANGHNVAVVEYHNGDSYTNTASDARNNYYNLTGYPTANFDGTLTEVGGSHTVSMYPNYVPHVNARNAVPSSFTVGITGTSVGNEYNVTLNISKVAAYAGTNLVVHLVLTESEISQSWQGMTELNFVERLMVPDHNGTPLTFTSGDFQFINFTVTKDPAWVAANCELVAFIQDNTTKEILQGNKVALTALPAPLPVNFTASQTTFCGPETITFTDQSTGATNWNWAFPGGSPATSTLQNPTVTYSTTGNYDVSLTAWNTSQGNKVLKSNYIHVTAAPPAAGSIFGPSGMCQNSPNSSYSITTVGTATTYEWVLTPSSAGVLTPGTNNAVIDWDPAFTGVAVLKVRGVNDYGPGLWSPALSISIDSEPTQAATPTGPTTLCMDAPDTEYNTTGATNISGYIWAISPASAGTITTFWTTGTVDWDPTYSGTATITVKGLNGGCEGPASNPITVTVNPGPQAFSVNGGGTACEGTAGVPVGLDDSENGLSYSLLLNGVVTGSPVAGTGNAISFGNQTTQGTYTVKGSGSGCETNMNGSANVVVKAVPAVPSTPTGPTEVVAIPGMLTPFTTTAVVNAETYEWKIEPATAGTMQGDNTTGNAVWGNVWFNDNALITVKAVNECGTSSFSEAHTIAVENFVGVENPGKGQFRIYPNPTHDFVTIENTGAAKSTAKFFNLAGQLVKQIQLNAGDVVNVNLSQLGAGVYQLMVSDGQTTQTLRLVVE